MVASFFSQFYTKYFKQKLIIKVLISRNKIFFILIMLNLSNFYNYLVLIFTKVQFKDNRLLVSNISIASLYYSYVTHNTYL